MIINKLTSIENEIQLKIDEFKILNSIPKINSRQEKLNSIPGTLKTFSTYNNKCPHCRQRLSTTDFTMNTEKK